MSHRLFPKEWENPYELIEITQPYEEIKLDEDEENGILSKRIIASCLSRLDRCPEFGYYAYTKCVLHRKVSENDVIRIV